MKNIFLGLFFIFFDIPIRLTEWFGIDFELGINDMVIDILPPFVGFGLIAAGLISMRGKTKNFTNAQWIAIAIIPLDLLRWSCAFLGLSLDTFGRALQIIIYLAEVALFYFFIKGLEDITAEKKANIGQKGLKKTWYVMVVFDILMYLFSMPMQEDGMVTGALILALFVILGRILFILAFRKMSKKYYNYSSNSDE